MACKLHAKCDRNGINSYKQVCKQLGVIAVNRKFEHRMVVVEVNIDAN